MLRKINDHPIRSVHLLRSSDPDNLFPRTLEFSPPARGTWNIVHTGMQLPESHQIYVCGSGCLRGVILTAAEMGCMDRFSTIELLEKDLLRTDNEALILQGVTDILKNLTKRPRAVLLFTACFHHFMGTDLHYIFHQLSRRFPEIDFIPCIMDPIRQTKSITPEERLRREIYRQWRPLPLRARACNIIGSNLPTDDTSEILTLLQKNGWTLRDMTTCRSYDDFLQMAEGSLNLYINPFGHRAALDLQKRYGQDFLFLPQSWRYSEITDHLNRLADKMQVSRPDFRPRIAECELAFEALKQLIGDTPIAIDCTFTFCPFSLARLLVEHGFRVLKIYSDTVPAEDRDNFEWLKRHYGSIELWSTKNPDGRLAHGNTMGQKILCLGQKAAWFNGSPYFVNLVEGGGHYGFDGLLRLIHLMSAAFLVPKNLPEVIRRKGCGGSCCL